MAIYRSPMEVLFHLSETGLSRPTLTRSSPDLTFQVWKLEVCPTMLSFTTILEAQYSAHLEMSICGEEINLLNANMQSQYCLNSESLFFLSYSLLLSFIKFK